MRDKHSVVFSERLEDKIIDELRKRRKNSKSWNLLFKKLLYGNDEKNIHNEVKRGIHTD